MAATIALAGNPNSGKTTLFNELTGARQHVGNYPGVTVEKKQGAYVYNGTKINIVDLPGTYSLSAYTLEELVARDFLVNENPEVVISIVDASNLERNLYLALQFLEMGKPVCIALNMMDVARKRGIEIDVQRLSDLLGVPVIPTIARSGQGKVDLMDAAVKTVNKQTASLEISYGNDIDQALAEMTDEIRAQDFLTDNYNPRWVALKYLEEDKQIRALGKEKDPEVSIKLDKIASRVSAHLQQTVNSYPESVIADHRYGYINAIIKQGVIVRQQDSSRLYLSDRIDKVLTNRFMGPLIMAAVIVGLYHFTFTYSEIPVGWLEDLFGWFSALAESHLRDGLLKSLVISGIIDGVGGVLGFVPLIMFMFLGIALLEDSGYLARVAFMLDRAFRYFGLHGSSVMPFIISGGIAGGCAVPGVMAARTLKSPRERLATMLTAPFMSCGAKLPVFAILVAAFFTHSEAMIMVIITLVSWAGALIVAKFLRMTVIKGPSTPFVMELPPYRLPTFKGLAVHTWEKTWQYIKKAGTVILGISILLWAMMTFPGLSQDQSGVFEMERQAIVTSAPAEIVYALEDEAFSEDAGNNELVMSLRNQLAAIDAREAEASLRNSIAGRLGATLEGISSLAGFDWRTNIALIGGFAAKEVVVSTLGTAYSLGEVSPEEGGSLSETLADSPSWSPLAAMSLIIFTIFYAPCFVTVVCIVKESGSWKWGAFSMIFNTALAFVLATLVFQVGTILGLGV